MIKRGTEGELENIENSTGKSKKQFPILNLKAISKKTNLIL